MQCNYSVGVMQYDASVPIEKRCGAHFQKMISLFMRLNVLNDIKKTICGIFREFTLRNRLQNRMSIYSCLHVEISFIMLLFSPVRNKN